MGLAPDDAEPEPAVKGKAAEAVAKKAGVSTRTFERGKKIIENASEDEKQKLREGKTSIAQVYREVVEKEKPKDATPPPEEKPLSAVEIQNKKQLLELLDKMVKQEIFCPQCGASMFECSKCHKTLKDLAKK